MEISSVKQRANTSAQGKASSIMSVKEWPKMSMQGKVRPGSRDRSKAIGSVCCGIGSKHNNFDLHGGAKAFYTKFCSRGSRMPFRRGWLEP